MLSFSLFNNHLASAKENYTGIMLLAYINCKMFKILKCYINSMYWIFFILYSWLEKYFLTSYYLPKKKSAFSEALYFEYLIAEGRLDWLTNNFLNHVWNFNI